MERQESLPYRGAPFPTKWRRNHPRSKNGCLTCRTKRKKCDEVKPICTACMRTRQDCVWPTPERTSRSGMEDNNSNELLAASAVSPDSAASQSTSSPKSPRPAPTYGNLAYLSDNSRPLYQQYLDVTAEMLTRGPCVDGNPFINYLLPLAANDKLVLDCVLAIGGAHLTVNDNTSTIQRARALEVATRGHYATILAGLQKLIAYQTGQVSPGMDQQTGPPTPIRILLILLLLCVYDHVQGHSRGSMYHHLKACRQYITLLTSEPTTSDELNHLKGFMLELYAYHALKITITPRSFVSDEVVEIDPSVHSLDVLKGYKSRGFLLGFGQGLWEMVPEISQLVEARRQEEKRDITAPTAFQEQYDSLLTRLEAYSAFEENIDGLRPRQERATATFIYQNALIVYLQSAFHQNMLADANLATELDTRVEQMMPAFYSLFIGDSPYRRMLLWPGTIMASVSRRKEHIHVFRAGFFARASRTPGAVKMGAQIVELLWNDPDPRAFGPRGLSYIMTKHDISFSMC